MDIKKIDNFRRRHLGTMFIEKGFIKGVEVGVYKGTFSEQLCNAMPGVQLTGVDDYSDVELRAGRKGADSQEVLYQKTLERFKPYKDYKLVRKTSMEAVLDFPFNSIDFIYIDGGHQFDYVMCDIIEWSKRVKKGGIISGHDYYRFINGNVLKAVDMYAKMHKVKTIYMTDERVPSFWFEKTWE